MLQNISEIHDLEVEKTYTTGAADDHRDDSASDDIPQNQILVPSRGSTASKSHPIRKSVVGRAGIHSPNPRYRRRKSSVPALPSTQMAILKNMHLSANVEEFNEEEQE